MAIGGKGGVTDDTNGGDMPIPGTPGGRGGRGMGGTAGKPVMGPIVGIPKNSHSHRQVSAHKIYSDYPYKMTTD